MTMASYLEPRLEPRVHRLELLMENVLQSIKQSNVRTERALTRVSFEMTGFKDEMAEFKDEMAEFKDEMRADRKAMNKQWGELANKWGTLVEDIVAPSVPHILHNVVNCPPSEGLDMQAVRMRRKHPQINGKSQEFDVVAACGGYVLIAEAKSSLSAEKINHFIQRMKNARDYFPEYADKEQYRFIGALATLYVDQSVVRYGEKQGVLILGLGDHLMDAMNEDVTSLHYF